MRTRKLGSKPDLEITVEEPRPEMSSDIMPERRREAAVPEAVEVILNTTITPGAVRRSRHIQVVPTLIHRETKMEHKPEKNTVFFRHVKFPKLLPRSSMSV